jgi:uncharacterized protein (UPF0332 family)
MGVFFSDLYDRRQTGDYDDFIVYDEMTVRKIYDQAKEFISRMADLINAQ